MHKLWVSEGVVLGKRGIGEANTLVAILTKEFGLIKAVARSARRENSKLRYGLEPLTYATYSFVRGKYEWKLTGAQDASRELVAAALAVQRKTGRIIRLLMRLIPGEEPHEALYATVTEGLRVLGRSTHPHSEHIETVLVLRILSHLGYLPHTPELKPFIERDLFAIELQAEVEASKELLAKAIQESLRATGL